MLTHELMQKRQGHSRVLKGASRSRQGPTFVTTLQFPHKEQTVLHARWTVTLTFLLTTLSSLSSILSGTRQCWLCTDLKPQTDTTSYLQLRKTRHGAIMLDRTSICIEVLNAVDAGRLSERPVSIKTRVKSRL